ncbi:MAG: [protein-PII] uridylyltransferase [Gammaproteobacteria bacterium]|nr:[protein-PII] uridylyltransferase [Gammaproteobacteria bacterium]MCI0590698.1 [protein-PII] uridylyltransferase [Gammaproteobacteria bacterium]
MSIQMLENPSLFDAGNFDSALRVQGSPIAVFKRALNQGNDHLTKRFWQDASIRELVAQRAWLIDQLLISAWRRTGPAADGLALVAVGGYGRRELHPASDIDIMVLRNARIGDLTRRGIEEFLVFLWDIGLEVAHSVRTVKDCVREAKADVTVATNLMEARLVIGNPTLFSSMLKATGPSEIWPIRAFFEAKLQEQIKRHRKFDDAAHNLEPNIKEGPGGLRDIQMISWVASRHFGAEVLHDLVKKHFLTEEEFQTLDEGQAFLWQLRFALHTLTGRREDRLQFDYQRRIANAFGYQDDTRQLGVERLMKTYYRTVTELSRVNEMLLQLFQEAILYSKRGKKKKARALNRRFQVQNDFIEARHDTIFQRFPFALLELFLLLQQHPEIKGVRASTIRLIRNHRHLIDESFRNDLRNRSLFLEIIRTPNAISRELRRMHRYGILGAYVPIFEAIVGLMQFDLFHVYTVDEHILFVIRNVQRFRDPESLRTLPLCFHVMHQLPKPELLYLAGLFHDIAKGRGADHSEFGAKDALGFCLHHGLSPYDARLVAWLVSHHLVMSLTAQRQDISHPEVISQFALVVGDRIHLDYLYLLTVADIQGTNPTLWNRWKDALLAELYHSTLRALRRGLENPIDKAERIGETQSAALALLNKQASSKKAIIELWDQFGEDYFLRHSPDEIAWHTQHILNTSEDDLPLVLVRPETHRGGTEVFIYMHDEDLIFASTTTALDQLDLTVQDARIITAAGGYTLDTYIVLEATGEVIRDAEREQEIVHALKRALSSLKSFPKQVSRRAARQLRHFPIPTEVLFSSDAKNARTVMEVIATDRPGFLARIGMAMFRCSVRLQNAKIATYGERVEDVFFITDKTNRPITDPAQLEHLRQSIIDSLSPP